MMQPAGSLTHVIKNATWLHLDDRRFCLLLARINISLVKSARHVNLTYHVQTGKVPLRSLGAGMNAG
jgi:hypothetical protein